MALNPSRRDLNDLFEAKAADTGAWIARGTARHSASDKRARVTSGNALSRTREARLLMVTQGGLSAAEPSASLLLRHGHDYGVI